METTATEDDFLMSTIPTSNEDPTEINPSIELFFFVCNKVLSPTICLFGFIFNCLGIGVLWKDSKKKSLAIYSYLSALTFFDTVFLALAIVRFIPGFISLYDEELGSYTNAKMNLRCIYVDICLNHTSVCLVVAMSLERLMALTRPLHVKDMILARYPKVIIGFCFVFNAVFLIPFGIFFELRQYQTADNVTHYDIQTPFAIRNNIYWKIQSVFDQLFIPIFLTVINIAIAVFYYRIVKNSANTLNTQSPSRYQLKITLTACIISVFCILLSVPMFGANLLSFIDDAYDAGGSKRDMYWYLIDVGNLFSFINAANDFLIFTIASGTYKQIFIAMYCKPCCRQKQPAPQIRPYIITGDNPARDA